ncbi:DUF4332 domain-containing protein [Luteolibacter sp. AS25]|uniref:DUF4332 domain-containing protein n=1 Tax=Luteolibacter sp. AS25 TaxID=3135776 RepID=UPI00398A6562
MPELRDIPGIGSASLDLLESAGIQEFHQLLAYDAERLAAELKKANDMLKLAKRDPSVSSIEKWMKYAVEVEEVKEPDRKEDSNESEQTTDEESSVAEKSEEVVAMGEPVNYETDPEVLEMLSEAPFAIPLPGKKLMENELRVSDIPEGQLLSCYAGDLDVKTGAVEKTELAEGPSIRLGGKAARPGKKEAEKMREKPKFKAINSTHERTEKALKLVPEGKEDRVALIRAPREKTNRGKDPNSRRYVRGVLHTHPWSLRIGGMITLLLVVVMPLAIISAFLLLVSREFPMTFPWVPKWILAFPIALPLVGFGYLIWGRSGKCRICNQRLFTHKAALKHIKAHRIPGLGYVIPLTLHMLAFGWFRCSSCGTPVRLKK